ncbi:hypothetical protein D7X25_18060 [bacterium 1XD42-8]|nr:hypothetical protein D7X25_18060 [bacterium 1XD42-8]
MAKCQKQTFSDNEKAHPFKADALFFKMIWYFGLWTGFKRKCVEQKNTAIPSWTAVCVGNKYIFVLIDVWPVPAPAMPMVSPFRGTAPASP